MGKYLRTPFCRVPQSVLYILFGSGLTFTVLLLIDFITSPDDTEEEQGDPIPYQRLPADAVLMVPEIINQMTWTSKENVLNYECGNNAVGFHLIFPKVKKHEGHMWATDSNWVNVEMARSTFPHPDITYGDANLARYPPTFPFPNMKFDKAFAIFVFHFAPDMQRMLERFRDLLKPGGQLGFTMLSDHNVMLKLKQVLLKLPKWRNYATYKPAGVQTKEDMEKRTRSVFENSGFKIKYWRVQQIDVPKAPGQVEEPIDHEYIIGVAERE